MLFLLNNRNYGFYYHEFILPAVEHLINGILPSVNFCEFFFYHMSGEMHLWWTDPRVAPNDPLLSPVPKGFLNDRDHSGLDGSEKWHWKSSQNAEGELEKQGRAQHLIWTGSAAG